MIEAVFDVMYELAVEKLVRAWYLDANTGLAPMSPFGVVSINAGQSPILLLLTAGLDVLPARVLHSHADSEESR
jgi:hypothetical protein